eukprot:4356829-Amphidinium_carterae.1
MLQGHFSRLQTDGEAIGTNPKAISTLLKISAEEPGDAGPKMRYGYHASALSLRAFESVVEKGLIPGGQNDGDWVVRDSVHMCPLHPTHNDAIGIWGFNRPVKDRNKYDGPATQAIFVVDLLMLQEEYDVGIYQARSSNYLIPSVVPWNCVCKVLNARGTTVDMWHTRVQYGLMDASIDAQRLLSERQKKRTRTADPDFREKRQEMDREEFVNMSSNSASAQKPNLRDRQQHQVQNRLLQRIRLRKEIHTNHQYHMYKGPPPPPKNAPASSSSSGAQFGVPSAPKPPPPMHVKGTDVTRARPLGETIGTTWSGCYGELLSELSDVQTDFDKILPQRSSRLSIFSNQDAYNIPDGHPSSAVWPMKENNTKNCFAITSSFTWKAKGPTIKEAQRNLYLSLDGPLAITLSKKLSGYIGPSIEAYDIAKSFDYLLGHTLDHEYELLDVVRRELENRIAKMTNEQLMFEGAAWFGWHTERWENPIHFIPTAVFNSQRHQYVLRPDHVG